MDTDLTRLFSVVGTRDIFTRMVEAHDETPF
jgi:hypothetical protein